MRIVIAGSWRTTCGERCNDRYLSLRDTGLCSLRLVVPSTGVGADEGGSTRKFETRVPREYHDRKYHRRINRFLATLKNSTFCFVVRRKFSEMKIEFNRRIRRAAESEDTSNVLITRWYLLKLVQIFLRCSVRSGETSSEMYLC